MIHKLGGTPVVIFDRDHVVAVSGMQRREYAERRISPALEELLERRKSWLYDGDGKRYCRWRECRKTRLR